MSSAHERVASSSGPTESKAYARFETWFVRVLIGLFALVPVGFVVLGTRGLYYRDHVLFFRPAWWSIYTQLRRLELPILNLAHPAGLPHEASTNFALLTPNTLVLLLGPFERSYDLFVLSHFGVLCLGAFVLARRLGAERIPSVGAAVFVALAGPIVAFENLLVGLQGLAYTPWLWVALLGCRQRPGVVSAGFLGLASGFAAQGIMPELLLLDALGAALILAWPKLDHLRVPVVLSVTAGLVLGAGVASADLVPLVHALQGSERGSGFGTQVREAWSLVPLQFLELFVPSLWGLSELSGVAIPAATGVQEPPYLTTLYLGVGLPLALAGVSRRNPRSLALAAIAVFFFLVAMGPATPLHRMLSSLPLLRSSRYPVKYTACALPFLAWLIALSLRELRARHAVLRATILTHFILLSGIVLVFHSDAFEAWIGATARPYASKLVFEYFRDGDPVGMALSAIRTRVWPATVFSALALVLLVTPRLRGSPWLGPALVTTLAGDLFVGAQFAVMTAPVQVENMDPALRDAVSVAPARVFPGAVLPVPTRDGQSPFESSVWSRGEVGHLAWTRFRAFSSSDLEGLGSNPVQKIYQEALEYLSPSELHAVLARAGVSRMVSPVEIDWPKIAETRDLRGRRISVYEVTSARPRVAAHANWETASSTSSRALAYLTRPARAGSALLWDVLGPLPAASAGPCRPETRVFEATPADVIEVEVNSPCAALLVVQEVHRAGWKVELDGAETELRHAETGYIASFVPAGRHVVRFGYASLFRAWLPVSILSLLFSVGLVLIGWGRPRSAAAQPAEPR